MNNNNRRSLSVTNLTVEVAGQKILDKICLSIKPGQIRAIMGPNGSGKSTLAYALAGHPAYKITRGSIRLGSKLLINLKPEERAKAGLFLSFQNPVAVPGVPLNSFLRLSLSPQFKKNKSLGYFQKQLETFSERVNLKKDLLGRFLNDGLSGGEKKKSETLQLLALSPKFAILDEMDTGLDVDSLKIVAKAIKAEVGKGLGLIIITHYCRILNYLKPDKVYVLVDGRIIKSGDFALAKRIEEKGYEHI